MDPKMPQISIVYGQISTCLRMKSPGFSWIAPIVHGQIPVVYPLIIQHGHGSHGPFIDDKHDEITSTY